VRERKLTEARRLRVLAGIAKIDTGEMQAVLSRATVSRIEQGLPVSYRSAVLYCKVLDLDPDEYILRKRVIPIIEEIGETISI
jgi:transcriptional regulator with XRE-family HTH domain